MSFFGFRSCILFRWFQLAAAMVALTALSGCLSMKSYVDPSFRSATYQGLRHDAPPVQVVVTVKFETNGNENGRAHAQLESDVTKVLRASRLFSGVVFQKNPQTAELSIVVDNVGSHGAAFSKGFGTGLTMGLVGSEVVDGYVMTVEYTAPGKLLVTHTYKHAIHSTVGNHSPPVGMEPLSLQAAFQQVVEDMVLNCLSDLQRDHLL